MKKPKAVDALLRKLHGKKHLIVGNHDRVKDVHNWTSIRDNAAITVDGHALYLYHYPLREWPHMWRGTLHLYGHVHGNLQPLPGSMEVSSDVWGGKPVQIADMMSARQPFDAEYEQNHRRPLRLRAWE